MSAECRLLGHMDHSAPGTQHSVHMRRLTKAILERILSRELALRQPRFRLEMYSGRVSGSVISSTFRRKTDSQRQTMIWDALERAMGADAVNRVGMLLAYTPEEWDLDAITEMVRPQRQRLRKRSRAGRTEVNVRFAVTIERDEDGMWITECPSIPGCVSQGKTKEEALGNIQDAIKLCLQLRGAEDAADSGDSSGGG